ncbi:hypothetical protein [Streptomyces sp. NPDC050485]|uniref:hypothetical protein n=1 Tax=Streptomyces sp. NPDC050485 TaxID=3365617 RepID=UPI0037A0CA39
MTAGGYCRAIRAAMFAAVCVLLAVMGHALMSGTSVPWWALTAGALATGGTGWCLAGRERGFALVVSATVAAQVVLHSSFSLAQAVVRPALPGGASFAQQWAQYLLCGSSSADPLPEAEAVRMVTDAGLGSRLHSAPPGMGHMSMSSMSSMPSTSPTHMSAGSMARGMEAMNSTTPMDHMSHMGLGHMGSMGAMGHDMAGMSSMGMLAAHLLAALLSGLWLAYGERAAFRILRALAGWFVAPLRLVLVVPAPPHRPRMPSRRRRTADVLRQLFLAHAVTSRGPPLGTAVN